MLEVKNLTKIYEGKVSHRALDNISFEVKDGEFVSIMGPSGSGKTTLLNLISTIDRPTAGEIFINGTNPHHMKQNNLAKFRRRELGFVFQDFNLLDTLTVEENIVLPLTLDGYSVKEMEKRVGEVTQTLGIDDLRKKRTYEISGGQAQRTAIARAIIHSPTLLLADEPTGNLDSKASRDVMETLENLNQNHGTTMMMVTHDPEAASYATRVIFIKDGELYNEIDRGDNQRTYYQRIIDVLSLLGGSRHDLSPLRD